MIKLSREELRTNWLAALRGKKYKQTQEVLRNESGFCCLGVLCDIYDSNKWNIDNTWVTEYTYGKNHEEVNLPESIRRAVGIPKNEVSKLVAMNDEDQLSFRKIANYLEKEVFAK